MMKIAFNTQSTVSASALGRTGSRVPAKKSHIARNESSRSWDIGENREVCKAHFKISINRKQSQKSQYS
jgi:hypothetical protein